MLHCKIKTKTEGQTLVDEIFTLAIINRLPAT